MAEDFDLLFRPLTARSAILSVLLGAHPPLAPSSEIVEWGRKVGIAETTVRAALSRMVVRGDLIKTGSAYRLADRLLERQRQQDASLQLAAGEWDGTWLLVVVTSIGLEAAARLELRRTLSRSHFAELREGVWLRPHNLRDPLEEELRRNVEVFVVGPRHDAAELAARLFDLDQVASAGRELLLHARTVEDPSERLTTVAAIVRYLVADPRLPDQLLPDPWPVPELEQVHAQFSAGLMQDREQVLGRSSDERTSR